MSFIITMEERQTTNNLGFYRKNIFNPATMNIIVEDTDSGLTVDISRACNFDSTPKSNTTEYRLEAALEFIATLREFEYNNDVRCDLEQFMTICEEQHTLYDIDFATDNNFYQYDKAADWAQELTEELYDMDSLPWPVKNNIDWQGVADDLLGSGDYQHCDDGDGGVIIWQEI